jgi:hypothetical protein
MKKIKIVIRRNLPETNSSSSHAVVVSREPKEPTKYNFPKDSENYIVIKEYEPEEFGRGSWERYNDVYTKTRYVCGQISSKYRSMSKDWGNALKELEDLLIARTGCKGVKYDWIESYIRTLFTEDDQDELCYVDPYCCSGPDIDHQSRDLYEDLLESKDVMEDFIFNDNSWLFIGSDEIEEPINLYDGICNEKRDQVGYVRVEFNNDYFEFPLYKYPVDLTDTDYFTKPWFSSGNEITPGIVLSTVSIDENKNMRKDSSLPYAYSGIDQDNRRLNCISTPYKIILDEYGELF